MKSMLRKDPNGHEISPDVRHCHVAPRIGIAVPRRANMLSGHNPLKCGVVWVFAVLVEQLFVVDIVFVHGSPFRCKHGNGKHLDENYARNERLCFWTSG